MNNLEQNNFIIALEESIKNNWESIAITETWGGSVLYSTLACDIERNHQLWTDFGLEKGDKIAIVAGNSYGWAKTYFSIVTGGFVAVLLRPNMSTDEIIGMLNHSDSVLLYAEEKVISGIVQGEIQNIKGIIDLNQNQVIYSIEGIFKSGICADKPIEEEYPLVNSKKNFYYEKRELSEVCTIIYTSGTTGEPKGVMLSVGNISENMKALSFFSCVERSHAHINMILPFFHVYGLVDELIAPLCLGKQLIIMGASHSPAEICSICRKYKPTYLLTIPLLLNAIIEYVTNTKYIEIGHNSIDNRELHNQIIDSLGGEIEVLYSSGSSCPKDFENLLVEKLNLPLLIGYGMTECCTISLGDINHVIGSCGKIYNQTEVRIVPANSESQYGEIQVRGRNVFSGYYKNSIATDLAFSNDGWFKTGDLGYIDENGYLFITGRCKDMLLTSNGENIYPEEIEETMNASPYIKESILVQRGEKLYAIVVPDRKKADEDNLDVEALEKKIDQAVREASKKLPGFTIISGFELRDEPLERTPKGSLKRYLYSDGIKEN